MPKKFWMVWLNDSPTTKRRHTTWDDASVEATRIAGLNVGKKVFVLEAIEYCWIEPRPITTVIL